MIQLSLPTTIQMALTSAQMKMDITTAKVAPRMPSMVRYTHMIPVETFSMSTWLEIATSVAMAAVLDPLTLTVTAA